MADVQNFIIKPSDMTGFYRASDNIRLGTYKQEQEAKEASAKKAASSSFLTNYLDPKDFLTGTNYDPQIVKGVNDLLSEGSKLASQGVSSNEIMMALSPSVSRLWQYSAAAKNINQRIKDQLALIPANAGYNKAKMEELARREAFYGDGKDLKDPSTLDYDTDWLGEVVRKYPGQVTTDAAIDEFVKNSPKYTNTQKVKRINSKGGYEMKSAKVTAPSWAVVDENGEIVPRYEIAMEGGEPHTFNFETGKGVTADIRLMNEKDFDSLMRSNPGIADWVRGQVSLAGEDVNLSTPQAKNAARAIMYDELKRRVGGGIEDIQEIKDAPAPRVSVRVNNNQSGKSGEVQIRDVYGHIKGVTEKNDRVKRGVGAPLNELSATAQKLIINYANTLTGGTGDDALTQADIYVQQLPDGTINIVRASDKSIIAPIDFEDVNVGVQPGVKEKREVIKDGGNKGAKTISINDVPAGTKPELKNGKYYYNGKEIIM